MSKFNIFDLSFREDKNFDFVAILKLASLAVLSLLFFSDLSSWQTIHSESLYSKKIAVFTFTFISFFTLYNFKTQNFWKPVLFAVCFVDLLFLVFYSFYTQIPLNLFVGFLSLNLIFSGLFLSFYEVVFLFSGTIFSLLLFLGDRSLLNVPYSEVYFVFNTFSFALYAGASFFLQKFFIGSKSELGVVSARLLNQEELNRAVLKSLESAVLVGSPENLKALNKQGEFFLETFKSGFLKHLKQNKNVDFATYFELERTHFKIYESSFKAAKVEGQKVWLISDETENIKKQRELEQSKKLSAIGQLSAGLAHEIRNPLAGIGGSVELIKEGALDSEDSKKLFSTVLREIDRLNLLVTDFLGFASPEVKCTDKIEVDTFFNDLIGLIKLDPRSEGCELSFEFEKASLLVDESKMKQVFINLIINAFQAFSKRPDVYSSGPSVKLTGRNLDRGYEIKVEDNGDGIKKENLASIFEPFHTTKDKGTGLGLALSHRILEGHGASIDVESAQGVGTTFTVLFKK